jgi:hypothetical protein
MEKQSLISQVWQSLRLVNGFFSRHAASMKAIQVEYFTVCDEQGPLANHIIRISIASQGHLYKVTQVFYKGGQYSHLIAIGSHRHLIFDPPNESLYLDEWLDTPDEVITLYTQINKSI